MISSITKCCLLAGLCLQIQIAKANVKLSSLFSDHMVLQKGVAVNIWGTADSGEKITVSFHGQMKSVVADNGKWMVQLAALPYITKPSTLTVKGSNIVYVKDILVGEVWLCSGQSNMERQLGPRPPQQPITNWEQERDSANYPQIREYYVPLKYSAEKIDDVNNQWTVCSPETVTDFSAVGYFFAKNLYKNLKVPVGIIFSAFGGTPAEDWTSKAALIADPKLADFVKNYSNVQPYYQPQGKTMSGLYNGMINPLIPYTIKGVAWYQGEANNDNAKLYQEILPNMIANWRTDFHQGNFPFLIVQIAPNKDMKPEIREAQLLITEKVANTALIVTIDCGDSADIHPAHKQPVGERLALAAEALAYKKKIEYSGPRYQSFKVQGNKVMLHFTHTGKGLVTNNDAPLQDFVIAGADENFVTATATIKGSEIVVESDAVSKPVAVRYSWKNVPHGNLYNKEGLPASPFRTDPEQF